MQSINPATGKLVHEYTPYTAQQIADRIGHAYARFLLWKQTSFDERAQFMRNAAAVLRRRKEEFALLMAAEMGKKLAEGRAEIEKCAATCEYYAKAAQAMLADEKIETEARSSFITWQPLGVILAVMPWNFPFWQVFRFAAPNLMAGNVGVLKHASNVCGCALAIEEVFREAGFPDGCFSTLLAGSDAVEAMIADKHVRAVTLTGSTQAGKIVAGKAAALLKKSVLELGGSDAYVVLADADVKAAAVECAKGRLINAGQSCIAAKRFIVEASVGEVFEQHLMDYFRQIAMSDPHMEDGGIGPLARADLRDVLHAQVEKTVREGAKLLLGGKLPEGAGSFYPPTVLSHVRPGMTAFEEEMFGPVAVIIEARDEEDAFALANASGFGLGSAIFTSDMQRAEHLAKTRINAGQCFVNAFVRSDPRLPFGGIGESGYGRELGVLGIREFMNAKTIYIA